MGIMFRGGRGDMKVASDFTDLMIEVAYGNAYCIFDALGIPPTSDQGTVGQIELGEFIRVCEGWCKENRVPKEGNLDHEYLDRKIRKLWLEAVMLTKLHADPPFSHICWS